MSVSQFVTRAADGLRKLPPRNMTVVSSATIDIDRFKSCGSVFNDRLSLLRAAYKLAPANGYAMEFGVHKAVSLSYLAKAAPKRRFFGFDSFAGLPEAWNRSGTDTYEAGHFALDALPKVPENVTLVPGFFNNTLPEWLRSADQDVAFLHIDADLYSSAKLVLDALNDRLHPGAIVVFDELCDWQDSGVYANWLEGEWRALCEWMRDHQRSVGILGLGPKYSAAIVVVN